VLITSGRPDLLCGSEMNTASTCTTAQLRVLAARGLRLAGKGGPGYRSTPTTPR
jgi:hypothetical protein